MVFCELRHTYTVAGDKLARGSAQLSQQSVLVSSLSANFRIMVMARPLPQKNPEYVCVWYSLVFRSLHRYPAMCEAPFCACSTMLT